jgi:hypothetical protein
MSTDHPVQIDPTSPPRFDRIQLVLRLGIGVVLGWLGLEGGWFVALAFAALPLIAAIAISSEGADGYLRDAAPALWQVFDWLLRLSAYLMLLVDRFPTDEHLDVTTQIRFTGRPTITSALLRFATSIPSLAILGVLACLSSMLWPIAAATIVVARRVPAAILAYQRGVLRWQARLLAYHASLVVEYPPWAFDTDAPAPLAPATAVAP